jgi:hypothetical protein
MPAEIVRSIFFLFAFFFCAFHSSGQFNIAERDIQEKQYINAQNQAISGYAAMIERAIPPFLIYQKNKLQEFLANKPTLSLSNDLYAFTEFNQNRLDKYFKAHRVSRADFFASDERKMAIGTMLAQQKTTVTKNPLIVDEQVDKQADLVATYLNKKKIQNESELILTTPETIVQEAVTTDNTSSLKAYSIDNTSGIRKSEILAAQYFPKTKNKPIEEPSQKPKSPEQIPSKQVKQEPELVKNEVQLKPEVIIPAEEKDNKNESLEEKSVVATTTSEAINIKEAKETVSNPTSTHQEIDKTEEIAVEPIHVKPSLELPASNSPAEENYNYDKTFDGVFFHLQIAALSEKKNNDVLGRSFNIKTPVKNIKHNGLYKYYIDSFLTYSEAKKRKDELRANGFDVFIIAIQANKIIDVKHILSER